MDLGWIEFSVILGCGLVGFLIVNAFLERRRRPNETGSKAKTEQAERGTSEEIHTERSNSPQSWWEILRVTREASPGEIKIAFRKEIARYHPDRVVGLGSELRELAEQKAKEINWAYSAAKRERGFK